MGTLDPFYLWIGGLLAFAGALWLYLDRRHNAVPPAGGDKGSLGTAALMLVLAIGLIVILCFLTDYIIDTFHLGKVGP